MQIISEKDKLVISDFNEVEALRLALKLENDGINFYLRASQMPEANEAKDTFKKLVKEETEHLELFQSHLNRIIEEEKLGIEAEPGYEEAFFQYVDAGVFPDLKDIEGILRKIKCAQDAIALAEEIEIASINFYRAMYEATRNKAGQTILKGIIKEEQRHLKAFAKYREILEKKK